MEELLRRISANGFAEVEGLQVTGTLPVRQDIVNDIITGLLRDAQTGGPAQPSPPASKPSGSAASEINWWVLIDKLQVRLKEGKLILDFELRR